MFALIESCPDARPGFGWTGKAASLAFHSFFFTLAAALTQSRAHAPTRIPLEPPIWVASEPQRRVLPSRSALVSHGHEPTWRFIVPTTFSVELQPPAVDPVPCCVDDWLIASPGSITAGDSLMATSSIAGAPVDERLVDERPELLSHPVVRYPEVLREAGIEGHVLVETVLDTLGRAERDRTRVLTSAHPLFDAEAISVVLGSRYRPARVGGRAVRVRVQVPVNFQIR